MAATRLRIFISSVQKEFAQERAALRDYLRGDALMRRFFEPFLFEDERMGTGTGDMIERCRNAGLPEPEFTLTDGFIITLRRKPDLAFARVGGQVTGQVTRPVAPPVAGEVAGQVAGQVTGQVVEEVRRVVLVLHGEKSRKQLQEALFLKGRANFEERYLKPAVEAGLVEPTLPNKPNSRLQKYRLTPKGRTWLETAKATSLSS